jgi:splicing factor 1
MSDPYSKLKVPELKEELKNRGLPVTGKKAELVTRLTEHDAANVEDVTTDHVHAEQPGTGQQDAVVEDNLPVVEDMRKPGDAGDAERRDLVDVQDSTPLESGARAGVEDRKQSDIKEVEAGASDGGGTRAGAGGAGGAGGALDGCAYVWGPIPSLAGVEDPSVDRGRTEKKRKRKSRWEAVSEEGKEGAKTSQALVLFPGEVVLSNGLKINLPVALTGRHESGRPELVKLYTELAEVERKIRAGEFTDTRPEQERSPSPPPIYDAHGVRLNTRDVRMKENMGRRRNTLIEELIKEDPKYVVPPDYKPEKKVRKVPLELAQMGLVIGPRGNTQRRMQDETNTRISIRGRGSGSREGRGSACDEEPLHVMIIGDHDADVEKAVGLVERCLVPLEDEINEHKKAQLRELALINGTLKTAFCGMCGESGHTQIECPNKQLQTYQLPDALQTKVEEQYARDLARVNPEQARLQEAEYKAFLESLGGSDPRGPSADDRDAKRLRGRGPEGADVDNKLKCWVGNLPFSMDDMGLRRLFEPHGMITMAAVKGNQMKRFGFVHFGDDVQAKEAARALDGQFVDDRRIVVKWKGESDDGRRGGSQVDRNEENEVFVANLPFHVDSAALARAFEGCGVVVDARVITAKGSAQSKGFGFVTMQNPEQVEVAARTMNNWAGFGPDSRGRLLACRPASQRAAGGMQRGGGGSDAGEFGGHGGGYGGHGGGYGGHGGGYGGGHGGGYGGGHGGGYGGGPVQQPYGGHYGQPGGPPQPYAQAYNQYGHQGYGGYQNAPPLPVEPIPGPPDDVPPPPPPM